jgi:hypothetical protein
LPYLRWLAADPVAVRTQPLTATVSGVEWQPRSPTGDRTSRWAARAAQLHGRPLLLATSAAALLGLAMIALKDLVLIHLH